MIERFIPEGPDWTVPWDALERAMPWLAAMRGVPQDPIHHAEGDVWIHTRMVCEALVAMPAWRALAPALRERLFVAALLHDVAKPRCTVVEADGRVRSPGHSPAGAIMAREILWQLGWPASRREPVCALVRFHQVPYHAIDRSDARKVVIRLTQSACADELAMLCEADLRGRRCADQSRQLDNVELFRELCTELGCLARPYPFASDHARAMYFHRRDRDPDWPAFDDTRVHVTVMSGLPAAGKSCWVERHAAGVPVIELDAIRDAHDIDATEAQGRVVARAREQARVHLRGRAVRVGRDQPVATAALGTRRAAVRLRRARAHRPRRVCAGAAARAQPGSRPAGARGCADADAAPLGDPAADRGPRGALDRVRGPQRCID